MRRNHAFKTTCVTLVGVLVGLEGISSCRSNAASDSTKSGGPRPDSEATSSSASAHSSSREPTLASAIGSTSIISPELAASDGDAAVIRQMQLHGLELSKPRTTEFFLYFGTEASASAACHDLESRMAKIEIAAPEGDIRSWACHAWAPVVVTLPTVHQFRRDLEQVAASRGGEYDGWEVDAR